MITIKGTHQFITDTGENGDDFRLKNNWLALDESGQLVKWVVDIACVDLCETFHIEDFGDIPEDVEGVYPGVYSVKIEGSDFTFTVPVADTGDRKQRLKDALNVRILEVCAMDLLQIFGVAFETCKLL